MTPELTIRAATVSDLTSIVSMLADDPLGRLRERPEEPLSAAYLNAFNRINTDSNQALLVAESNGEVVGTLQLTFIQYLTHQGGLRAQIEAVRVKSAHRGKGIGAQLVQYAIGRAGEMGCYMVQLTTDKQRPQAIGFYENQGFIATHEGMKLKL